MKFLFYDRNGYPEYPSEPKEFLTLEEFVEWTVKVGLPRHTFKPPTDNCPYWTIYCESDYD